MIIITDFIRQSSHHEWGPWGKHVRGWLKAPLEGKLILRYEDMLVDAAACLKKALEFAEISTSDESIRNAVHRTSFNSMKKIEKTKGFNLEQLRNVEFVRKGKKGSWQDTFSPRDLKIFSKLHHGPVPELGYDW